MIVNEFVPGLVADGGTSPTDACDTHNLMLSRSNTLWNLNGTRRPVEVFTAGDSLSAQMGGMTDRSALWWAMAIYRLDLMFRTNLGVGTSVSGNDRGDGDENYGLTSATRLTRDGAAYAASVAAGYAPVAILSVQTNDSYPGDNGQNGAASTVANVEKYFLRMRARGLAHLVINSAGPSVPTGANAIRTRGIVLAYRALAAKYRGQITFVDNSTLLAANTPAYAALGGQFEYGATMYDEPPNPGLHPSARGAYMMGRYTLGPALLALIGRRTSLLGWVGDTFDAVRNSRGPVMGDQTRYGGAAIAIPDGVLSGTQTVEQADVSDPISEAIGRPDIIARRLRFAGTPSQAGRLSIDRAARPVGFDPTVTPFMPEANVYVDMTNIKAPAFGWVGGGVGGQSGRDCDVIPHLEGLLCLYAGAPQLADVNYGLRTTSLSIAWIAGKEVAGDLILISASDYPAPPLPPASV